MNQGVVLVVLVVLVVAGGVQSVAGEALEPTAEVTTVERFDAEDVLLEIELDAEGDAAIVMQFWARLDTEEDEAAFESIKADVESDPETYTSRFAERIEATVDSAATATNREMSVDGFGVEVERQTLGREYGVITYSFEWHGFSDVEGNTVRAGDAIERYYLDDGSRLAIAWPEGYELESVRPEPTVRSERAVVWRGSETEFVSGEPRVVISRAGLFQHLLPYGAGAFALLVLTTAWWYRRRTRPETADVSPRDAPASTPANDEPDTADGPPETAFMSNEERVLALLEANGGRLKQQQVVAKLDWTDAKTSQVVSRLREEGALESFRLGRENVLTLPEESDGA